MPHPNSLIGFLPSAIVLEISSSPSEGPLPYYLTTLNTAADVCVVGPSSFFGTMLLPLSRLASLPQTTNYTSLLLSCSYCPYIFSGGKG